MKVTAHAIFQFSFALVKIGLYTIYMDFGLLRCLTVSRLAPLKRCGNTWWALFQNRDTNVSGNIENKLKWCFSKNLCCYVFRTLALVTQQWTNVQE